MVQIGDVVVSFDVFREKFLCDLDACKGQCCIEGDAGAPVELDEVEKLEEVLPVIWDETTFPTEHKRTLVRGKFPDGYAPYQDYVPLDQR